MERIPIYIGFDPREAAAWHVCVQSIIDNAKDPERFEFHALKGEARDGSNAFTYARFLVPYLCGFNGSAVFLDGDMIVRTDLADLWELRQIGHIGAQVVKHDYQTKFARKYLGNKNEDYPRKNWSSVILWNCGFRPNQKLTPEFVAEQTGAYLHRFCWLDDEQIGELPPAWNRLVKEQDVQQDDKLLHYTVGTPCFKGYDDPEWREVLNRTIAPMKDPRKTC